LASDVIELLRNSLNVPKSITIDLTSANPTEYVVGDEDMIKQVLINLLTNAIEAVDTEDGKINVGIGNGIAASPEFADIVIADNGCGFDKDLRDKLFEPFFSRKKGGTGLGLAIVKLCLDNMKGQIEFESAPNAGSKFRVYLCRFQNPRDTEAIPTIVATASR
jgi:signal transduction histidine kinase